MERMAGTHSHYEFNGPWQELTKPFVVHTSPNSDSNPTHAPLVVKLRKSCHILCELAEHGSGYIKDKIYMQVARFTNFESLTLDFVGKLRAVDFTPESPYWMDKTRPGYREYLLRQRKEEEATLATLEKVLEALQKFLGTGEVVDMAGRFGVLHARRLVFYPLLRGPMREVQ